MRLVLLTLLHWQLMFTTLAVAPVVVLAGFAFGRLLRRRSTEVQDRLAEANAVADEAFSQVEIVQSFVREDWERQRYGAGIGRALDSALARAMVRALLFGVLTIAAFGGIVLVLWQGGRLVVTAQITAGQLISFLLYAFSVAAAIMTLGSLWTSYQEAQGAARRVFDLLDRRTVIVPPQSPVSLAGEGPPAMATVPALGPHVPRHSAGALGAPRPPHALLEYRRKRICPAPGTGPWLRPTGPMRPEIGSTAVL